MPIKRIALIATAITAISISVTACDGAWEYTPPTGEITEKAHQEKECKPKLAGKILVRSCTPETWTIVLDSGVNEDVSKEDWDKCQVKERYPECAQ